MDSTYRNCRRYCASFVGAAFGLAARSNDRNDGSVDAGPDIPHATTRKILLAIDVSSN